MANTEVEMTDKETERRPPTREEIGQAIKKLAEKGIIVDTGRRHTDCRQ